MTNLTLVNPQNGNLAFKIASFDNSNFDHIQRLNYYAVLLLQNGNAELKSDFSTWPVAAGSLIFFSPYQPFMFSAKEKFKGTAIYFHPDFFCIHKHHKEVACHGVLFNNIYDPPFIKVTDKETEKFQQIIEQMKTEMQDASLAQYELLVSHLKIFLIHASRLKGLQNEAAATESSQSKEPFILQNLKGYIEDNFKTKRSPADYAAMLNISPKTLAKATKNYFNKTLTDLIAERVIIEAKRELYLTSKPVKEIAWQLGFEDEYYFSRFFKKNADVSPQMYRETVGFARADA